MGFDVHHPHSQEACMMQSLVRNFRFTWRTLRKNLGLTAAVLATLMFGIGATTAMYTVVYAALIAPLPYPNPEQLMIIWSRVGGGRNVVSVGDFLDWKSQSTSFQQMAAWTERSFNLSTNDTPEHVSGRAVTPGYFNLQGFRFLVGRDFLPEEGVPGREHVLVLTHRLWSRLGADRGIVGKSLRVDGLPYTVVGVLAPGIADRLGVEMIAPLAFKPEEIVRNFHGLLVVGRLKPHVSMRQAQQEMDAIVQRIAQAYPRSNKGWGVSVEPLKDDFLPRERVRNLWLLLGAVGFVLLITCVNIANLLLARGATRQREMAVRSSMGASQAAIFAQLVTESIALALAGGALGVGLGSGLLRSIVLLVPEDILPSEANFQLDLHVLSVALLVTMACGVAFGGAPAWYASRIDPAEALKSGNRSSASASSQRLKRSLIVSEFALALALLAGAGLAIHSFWKLTRIDLGVRTQHVLSFQVQQRAGRFANPAAMLAYNERLLRTVRSVPGVVSVAAATGMPLRYFSFGMGFEIVGAKTKVDRSQRPNTGFQSVSPDYLRTFGMELIKGRTFTDQDTMTSMRVATVNQEFANRYLKGLDPLKQRIAIDELIPDSPQVGATQEWQIVGVTHNVRYGDFRGPSLEVSVPFAQSISPNFTIGVRTALEASAMVRAITAAVHSVDPDIALADVRTMDQVKQEALGEDRFTVRLFAAFAALALVLAAVGIYGLMSYSVSQRVQEIGLRLALGASRGGVSALVLGEAFRLAVAGLMFGMLGAFVVGRIMQGTLYQIGALDPIVILAAAGLLLLTALIAIYLPARRAGGVDPMQALRTE
jgi:putative ABC transport system permease protein